MPSTAPNKVSQGQIGFWVRSRASQEWFDGAPPAEDNRFYITADFQGPQWAYQGSLLKIHQEGTVSSFWIDGSAPGAGDSAALAGDLVYDDFLAAWWSHIPEGSTSNNAGSSTELFHFPGANNSDGYFDIPSAPIPYDSFGSLILISEDLNAGVTLGGDSVVIEGGDDFDIFISTAGNDSFDGGPGSGAVVYTGNAADYTVATDPDTDITTVTDTRTDPTAVTNGQDTLSNIERLIFADEIVVISESDDAPGPAPGPGPIIPIDPDTDAETATLDVIVRSVNDAPLPDATVSFSAPEGGSVLSEGQVNAEGRLSFSAEPGTAGRIDASLPHDPAEDGRPTAGDALDILRMAVGLEPSFGPAPSEAFIAADINRDGRVTAEDALDVLRTSVDIGGDHVPHWVFIDAAADWSGAGPDNVPQDTGIELAALPPEGTDIALTGILLGHMNEFA